MKSIKGEMNGHLPEMNVVLGEMSGIMPEIDGVWSEMDVFEEDFPDNG